MPYRSGRHLPRRLRRAATAALASFVVGTTAAHAQPVNTDRSGLALSGYDPVAYHVENRPVRGSAQLTAVHEGATYRFASTANRERFVHEPERYLPAYGGYCAYGVSRGYKVKIDPEAFSVVGGRLYLNYDKGVRRRWLENPARFIALADSNWVRIRHDKRR